MLIAEDVADDLTDDLLESHQGLMSLGDSNDLTEVFTCCDHNKYPAFIRGFGMGRGRGKISSGKVRAGLTVTEFQQELGKRGSGINGDRHST